VTTKRSRWWSRTRAIPTPPPTRDGPSTTDVAEAPAHVGQDAVDHSSVGHRDRAQPAPAHEADVQGVRAIRDLGAYVRAVGRFEVREISFDVSIGRIGADQTDGRGDGGLQALRQLDRDTSLVGVQAAVRDADAYACDRGAGVRCVRCAPTV
jgi:hypothetical protein